MVAASTLKSYIERCDDYIAKADNNEAKLLVKEIVSVLKSDFQGLTQGLDTYGIAAMNGLREPKCINDLHILRARLQKELTAIEMQESKGSIQVVNESREKKIFISHATKDKDYVALIVSLLESIGLREDEIICSSIPPYCVPLGEKVFAWLVNEFQKCDLHVIYALSKTYYQRPVCLNEMGAAWACKHEWTGFLLPGFGFKDIDGCIDPAQISIKLDDIDRDTLNYRLGEFKDKLITEFGLRPINPSYWERKRNEFLNNIKEVTENRLAVSSEGKSEKEMEESIATDTIGKDEIILLVYAANTGGNILVSKDITRSTPSFCAGKFEFNKEDTPKEAARWEKVVRKLKQYNLVEDQNLNGEVFWVTDEGYNAADKVKVEMDINTDKDPGEYLD